jgi:hypothetical protein
LGKAYLKWEWIDRVMPKRVFTCQRNPIRYLNTKAGRCVEAGRHGEFPPARRPAAHLARLAEPNGTPLRDLQKMGGWKTAPICGSTRIRRRHTQMAYHAAVVDGPLRVTSTIQPVEEGARQKQKRRHDHS